MTTALSSTTTREYPAKAVVEYLNDAGVRHAHPVLNYEFGSLTEWIQFMFNMSTSVENYSSDWFDLIRYLSAPVFENGTSTYVFHGSYITRVITLYKVGA